MVTRYGPRTRSTTMPLVTAHGFIYDTFPDGHYIHPFHDQAWEYFEDEGKEHPRTVMFPFHSDFTD